MKSMLLAVLLAAASPAPVPIERGIASVYGNGDGHAWTCVAQQKPRGGCYHMNPGALTAAHPTLPFDTVVKVVNLVNHRAVYLRINDRGPYHAGRIIDVTPAGAAELGMDGLAHVAVIVVGK